jgi:hypothetical protein
MITKQSARRWSSKVLRILWQQPECPLCTSIEFKALPPQALHGVLRLVNLVPLQCTNCWRYSYWLQNDRAFISDVDRRTWSN